MPQCIFCGEFHYNKCEGESAPVELTNEEMFAQQMEAELTSYRNGDYDYEF